MTSRQLIQNLLGRDSFNRIGLFDQFWPETAREWLDQGYPAETCDSDGKKPKPVDYQKFFEFDMRHCGGWFTTEPIRGAEQIIEETEEWIKKRTGAGATFRFWKNKSGTPEHVDFRMTSREIWERDYRPHLLELDPARIDNSSLWLSPIEERVKLEEAHADGKWSYLGHLFVWETMRQSLGDFCMFESLARDPGWIHDFNRVYTDFYKVHFRETFEQVGLPDGIWLYEDLGYKGGLFASPAMLADLFFPYFAEIVEFFHGFGLPVVLHSCGNITKALPMIVDAGFDALNPMEVKAGCDIFAFAENYGDQIAFVGGLDARILESNERGRIRFEIERFINGMKSRGARLIFGTDHSVSPLVRYDTYRYALDVYRECMWC